MLINIEKLSLKIWITLRQNPQESKAIHHKKAKTKI